MTITVTTVYLDQYGDGYLAQCGEWGFIARCPYHAAWLAVRACRRRR